MGWHIIKGSNGPHVPRTNSQIALCSPASDNGANHGSVSLFPLRLFCEGKKKVRSKYLGSVHAVFPLQSCSARAAKSGERRLLPSVLCFGGVVYEAASPLPPPSSCGMHTSDASCRHSQQQEKGANLLILSRLPFRTKAIIHRVFIRHLAFCQARCDGRWDCWIRHVEFASRDGQQTGHFSQPWRSRRLVSASSGLFPACSRCFAANLQTAPSSGRLGPIIRISWRLIRIPASPRVAPIPVANSPPIWTVTRRTRRWPWAVVCAGLIAAEQELLLRVISLLLPVRMTP